LLGEVKVSLFTDAALKAGRFEVHASVNAGASAPAPVAAPVVVEPSDEPPAAGIPSIEIPVVVPPVVVPPVISVPTISPPTIATPSIPPLPTLGGTPSAPAPAAAPMLKATLAMADGSRIALRPGVISVGRSAESTIPLNDTNVSRRHAELRVRGEGCRVGCRALPAVALRVAVGVVLRERARGVAQRGAAQVVGGKGVPIPVRAHNLRARKARRVQRRAQCKHVALRVLPLIPQPHPVNAEVVRGVHALHPRGHVGCGIGLRGGRGPGAGAAADPG
jgi:hypothetical protein